MRFPASWRDSAVTHFFEDLFDWARRQLEKLEGPLDRFDEMAFAAGRQSPIPYVVGTVAILITVLYVFHRAHDGLRNLHLEIPTAYDGGREQTFSDDERMFEQLLAEGLIRFSPGKDRVEYAPRDCMQVTKANPACPDPKTISSDSLRMLHVSAPGAVIRQEIDRWNEVRSLVAIRGMMGTASTADSQRGLWKASIAQSGITLPTHSRVPEEFGFIHQGKLSAGFGDWNALTGLKSDKSVSFTLSSPPHNVAGSENYVVQVIGCLDQSLMDQNHRLGWQVFRLPRGSEAKGAASRVELRPTQRGDQCDEEVNFAYRLVRPWPEEHSVTRLEVFPIRFSPDQLPGYALALQRPTWAAMRAEWEAGSPVAPVAALENFVELQVPKRSHADGLSSALRVLHEKFPGHGTSWSIVDSAPNMTESTFRVVLKIPKDLRRLSQLRLAVFGRVEGIKFAQHSDEMNGQAVESEPDASAFWAREKAGRNENFLRLVPQMREFQKFADLTNLEFQITVRHLGLCEKGGKYSCTGFARLRYKSTVKRNVDVTDSSGIYLYSRDLAPKAGEDRSRFALVQPGLEGGLDISNDAYQLGLGPILGATGLAVSPIADALPAFVNAQSNGQYQLSIDRRIQALAHAAMMRQVRAMGNQDSEKSQDFSHQRRGALIILEAETGAILAASSAPEIPAGANAWDLRSFDRTYPDSSPLKHSGWELLSRHYSPGSTFKPMSALLAARVDPERGWNLRDIQAVTERKSYAKLNRLFPGFKAGYPDKIEFGDKKWGWNPALRNFAPSGIKWNDPKGIGLDVGIENSLNVYLAYLTLVRHQPWLREQLDEIPECSAEKIPDTKIYLGIDGLERSPLIQIMRDFQLIGESSANRPSNLAHLHWPIFRPDDVRTQGSILQPALGRVSIREQQSRQPAYTVVKGNRIGCEGLAEQIRHKLALHGIGQGIALTPLDVARIAAVVANASEHAASSEQSLMPVESVRPFLITPYPASGFKSHDAMRQPEIAQNARALYSRDAVRLLATGMHGVVASGTAEAAFRGTGLVKRGRVRTLFGKTGTADVRQLRGETDFNSTWFMGWYEPSEAARSVYGARRIAFSCFLSHGYGKFRFGGQACAPVLADFLNGYEAAVNPEYETAQ